ncbi:MAG: hypothetical protein LBR68_03505, partial [Lachnoclostridium sp.]|nr:hypothetical protein [Lachnoclostridium sp.]
DNAGLVLDENGGVHSPGKAFKATLTKDTEMKAIGGAAVAWDDDYNGVNVTTDDYNTGVLIKVTLPESTTLDDFSQIQFSMTNKSTNLNQNLKVGGYADNTTPEFYTGNIYEESGFGSKPLAENVYTSDLGPLAGKDQMTGDVYFAIGLSGAEGTSYSIKDIVLLPKYRLTVKAKLLDENVSSTTGLNVSVSEGVVNAVENASFNDYNEGVLMKLTLPEGEVLSDFLNLSFELSNNGANAWKGIRVGLTSQSTIEKTYNIASGDLKEMDSVELGSNVMKKYNVTLSTDSLANKTGDVYLLIGLIAAKTETPDYSIQNVVLSKTLDFYEPAA